MTTIRLGDVTIETLVEIDRSSFPTTQLLPDSTPEAIARHHAWLRPHFFDERVGDLGRPHPDLCRAHAAAHGLRRHGRR